LPAVYEPVGACLDHPVYQFRGHIGQTFVPLGLAILQAPLQPRADIILSEDGAEGLADIRPQRESIRAVSADVATANQNGAGGKSRSPNRHQLLPDSP
jgi:hypothetical protein